MQWLGTITNALGLTKKSNPQSSSVNLQKVVAHNPSTNATRINMNRKTNNNLEEVITQEGGKRRRTHKKKATKHHKRKHTRKH
jgi:hypothetical protein